MHFLTKNELGILTVAVALTGAATTAIAADQLAPTRTPIVAEGKTTPNADNTSMNSRDKTGATLTPQNQNNRIPDRDLLAAVRRAVVADKSLSSMAQNVKIVATEGVITLRGPVKSEDEKSRVEKAALQVAGVSSVQNQLDVKVQ